MNYSGIFEIPVYFLFVIIFFLIICFGFWGYSYKKNQLRKDLSEVLQHSKIVESTTLSTLSLLMGFTFSVAMGKFETQRRIIVQEASYIKTALLRCDMYPDSIRNIMRQDFKE